MLHREKLQCKIIKVGQKNHLVASIVKSLANIVLNP